MITRKNLIKLSFISILIIIFIIGSFLANQYLIKKNVRKYFFNIHNSNNPLSTKSDRLVPSENINNESDKFLSKLNKKADLIGAYSALVDWPVVALHATLLPDGRVLTFGSHSTKITGDKLDENKTIKFSNGKELNRNAGSVQWQHHEVFHAVDVDLWDYKKGLTKNSHNLIEKPLAWDAFCSISRVLNLNDVFILGGNEYTEKESIDWNNRTVIFNAEKNTFKESQKLNYPRWYGSTVRIEDKLYMFGGIHNKTNFQSIIPEVIDLNKNNNSFFWKEIKKAESKVLFYDNWSWHYPKVYLGPDRKIFGISYNKLWNMDPNDNSIKIVGEIPLEKGLEFQTLNRDKISSITQKDSHTGHGDENKDEKINYKVTKQDGIDYNLEKPIDRIYAGTVGAPVGSRATSVMINDEIYMLGGLQFNYMPSNKMVKINIDNSNNPKLTYLEPMSFLRSFGNSTVMPNGNIFVNGGQSYADPNQPHSQLFPVYTSEIYDVKLNKWQSVGDASMPRNYHNNSILLLDGSMLIMGGDTWTAEIYYPSYLFEKTIDNKLILAERPKISKIKKNYNRDDKIIIEALNEKEISRFTLLSLGSTTHSQAVEPKFYDLNYEKKDNLYEVEITKSKSLNKGVYILTALNEKGVPSISQTLMIQ
jgi:N-acetylneuraminic acid mutarotase